MTKNLFLTTAIVTASLVANSALAENITERQVIESDDTETFTNITANGINSDGFKGGVIYNEGIFTITGTSNFVNNTAKDGGVIYNKRSGDNPSDSTNPEAMSVKIQGASFTNNTTKYSGGVIFNYEGSMSISNSTFNNNQTGDFMAYGGAIHNGGTMVISDSTFNDNMAANSGGAIYNSGTLTIKGNSSFAGNKYDVSHLNDIFNTGALNLITGENEIISFASGLDGNGGNDRGTINISGGGKVHVENELIYHNVNLYSGTLELVSGTSAEATSIMIDDYATLNATGVTFSDQTYEEDGANIYNEGMATISDSEFKNNKVASEGANVDKGGAIDNYGGKMNISNTTFTNNQVVRLDGDGENIDTGAKYGGAISNQAGSEMSISGATFSGNKTIAYPTSSAMGGAIHNSASKLTITNAVFANNETSGGSTSSGGAIYNDGDNYGSGILEISNSTFINNKSVCGGAIENSAQLTLENVSFVGNQVNFENDHSYARGGALWNYDKATITNGSFINNSAAGDGGAIYHSEGTISFSGNTVFEGNTSGGQLNDIYNASTINVAGNMSLDGGLTGYSATSPGKITFANGSNLNVKAGTTTIVNNEVKNEGATLGFTVGNGFSGDYALISNGSTLDNEFTLADNNLYNISVTDTKGTYTISRKSASEIADKIGASSNNVAAIWAITDGDSTNPSFNKIADNISEILQSDDASQVQAALDGITAMSPDADPTVQQTQTETTYQVFNAVGTRLSGSVSGNSRGMSSGDASENGSVWMQGLVNHTKLNKTSKTNGFKADTYGVALGLEKKINSGVKAGVGYAYSSTDADTKGRDTKVTTHTLLAYGEYKPSNWFVNGIVSYGWSDYKEDKNVAGTIVKAKYDVKTLGMQAMVGYDLYTRYATVTPLAGLRYMHIDSDNYVDSAGQEIASSDSNILTGVIGSKISKTVKTETGIKLTPEARLAMTYDLKQAHNKSNVVLPNGSSYNIDGESLNRFGIEVGGSLAAEFNGNVEMSLGYEGSFRKDYQNHNVLLNLKYKF